MKFANVLMLLLLATTLFAAAAAEKEQDSFSICVFIPGQIQGSPTYELLVKGVQAAVAQARDKGKEVRVKILEGGYNQAGWENNLRSLAATANHDLIVSSNPSIPDLIRNINRNFPGQKYLVMDAEHKSLPNVSAIAVNQYQQAYLSGYFAGLVTISELPGANPQKIAGILVGQEYPVMNEFIRPGFADGLRAAAGEESTVEYRVLGNWYDAEKARELANSMIRRGADVILTIAGSGNQGAISAAQSAGSYLLWYDSAGYSYGSDTVLGNSVLNIDNLAQQATLQAIDGALIYDNTKYVGIADGAVDYTQEYADYISPKIPQAMNELIKRVKNGEIKLEVSR